jgi:hypothetical protein
MKLDRLFIINQKDGIVINGIVELSGQPFFRQPFNPFTLKPFESVEEAKNYIKSEFKFDPSLDSETETTITIKERVVELVGEVIEEEPPVTEEELEVVE